MDRLSRPMVACGIGLLLASTGCRATRNEVPPGRPFTKDGQQRKAIEFSSEGHPVNASAASPAMSSNLGGSNLASGIGASSSRPDARNFGAPPGSYGPPGTAGLGQPPSLTDPATSRASGMPDAMPPAGLPPLSSPPVGAPPALGSPPAPDLQIAPPSASRPAPSQVVLPPLDAPGAMGTPDQLPSPN